MKKLTSIAALFAAVIVLLCAACGSGPKTAPDELDARLREVSDYLNGKVQKGSKAVFLNITSPYPDLSEYILSVLSENAVNDGVFSVVDRQQLDAIRAELNFQYSGEVSDQSAQQIGQMLGAQTIVSGTVGKVGELYRLQIKAIEVQSAAIQGQVSKSIPAGSTIAALTQNTSAGGGTATASGQASTGGQTSSGGTAPASGGTAAAPAVAANIANGTYTFWPRPRAMQEGRDVNVYLDRIVVRGGYFTMYFTDKREGTSRDAPPMGNTAAYNFNGSIQNLDSPNSRPIFHTNYTAVYDNGLFQFTVVFNNHNVRKFSFSWTNKDRSDVAPIVLEEIIMPDQPDE